MTVTRGFHGRHDPRAVDLPPGQHLTTGFPVLSTGPAHNEPKDSWTFAITSETGGTHTWTWQELMRLPTDHVTTDIHCVTRWSKLGTTWKGVSLDVLFEYVDVEHPYAMAHSYGGYTTNLSMADLTGGRAWIAFEYDGRPLTAEHGGPARLLVPHLYFWKSAKWVKGIRLKKTDEPGFWERNGYHNYGDPWREERHTGD
jgi:DMSO/TMAO reductase YedYZ molybdopterin-dependent catalytic subunit